MKRKSILIAGAASVLVALAVFAWKQMPTQADLRPVPRQNVLLITIDTLRADALGAYGGPAATPALDRLAGEGVRFDFAHAHSVMTLPSHASIMTGQYPFQHGLRDNSGYRLPSDARTAAHFLKQAGYATAAFVAAFPLESRFGLNVGFDTYDDHLGDAGSHADLNMTERPAAAVVPLAQAWLAGQSAQPSFLWVHVFDPHAPYRPPPPFDTQFSGQPYYGEVAATDAALAPLLEQVRRSDRPTLVIVTSDHGEGLGEHGEEAHGIFAYESTLRVPLIIAELGGAASRRSRGGEVSSVGARHVDLLPTMLDAVGQAVPVGLPGRSLLPKAERAAGAPARPMYFEAMSGMLSHGWAPLSGVLDGRDKFIDLPIAERYDLAGDPGERANLAGRESSRDRALAAVLGSFSASLPGLRQTESNEAITRLRALGYVSVQAPAKAKYTEADDPKRLIDLDQMLHRALDAFGAGRLVEANDIYKEVIARRPDMAIAYRHIALIESRAGNLATAVAVLRTAVARGITDRRLLALLGEYLTDMGSVGEGLSILEPLGREPNADSDTLNALAIAYARARRSADARAVFERLAVLMPSSSAPLENLGVLALQDRDFARAATFFDRAIAVNPTSWRAENGRAAIAFERGDRAAAYAAWRRSLALNAADAGNLDALFSLGMNLARDGQLAEARPLLAEFLRLAPAALTAERQEAQRLLR